METEYTFHGTIERNEKLEFLRSLDIFSVPTEFKEPKALYALEALAAGIPVVAPYHGAFPELADTTGGLRLFAAHDTDALQGAIEALAAEPRLRRELGQRGQASVFEERNAISMARITGDVLVEILEGKE